jgi:hypothetical protein
MNIKKISREIDLLKKNLTPENKYKLSILESKKAILERKSVINEFSAEIVGTNKVVINNKKYDIDKLPKEIKRIVMTVMRYIGKNIKSFTKYDLTNWDIQTKSDGTVKVTDDNGRSWSYKI